MSGKLWLAIFGLAVIVGAGAAVLGARDDKPKTEISSPKAAGSGESALPQASTDTSTGQNNPSPNPDSRSTPDQGMVAIDLTNDDEGRLIELANGQSLKLTALQQTWVIDLIEYDNTFLKETGNAAQYQKTRTLKTLKTGQTTLVVLLTSECAIPREGYYRCLVASRQLTLKIVIK